VFPGAPSFESPLVPKPLPRQRNTQGPSSPATVSRHSPYDSIDGLSIKESRKTPVNHSKSPVSHSKSPLFTVDKHALDEADDPYSRRTKQGKSPSGMSPPEVSSKGRTDVSQLPQYRGTPVDGYRTSPLDRGGSPVEAFSDFHTVRKQSTGSVHRGDVEQYQDELFGHRKSPAERFNSPHGNRSRNSPFDQVSSSRKSPGVAELSKKTTTQHSKTSSMKREAESPPTVKHKGSVIDFLTEKPEKFDGTINSPSTSRPPSSKAKNPFDKQRKEAEEEASDDKVTVSKKKIEKAKSDQLSMKRVCYNFPVVDSFFKTI
jgi:hypothetical protein